MKAIIILLASIIISNTAYSAGEIMSCPPDAIGLAVCGLIFVGIYLSVSCSSDEITQTQINKAMESLKKRDLDDIVYYSAMEILHNAKRCQDKKSFLKMYHGIKNKRVVWPDSEVSAYFDYIKSLK